MDKTTTSVVSIESLGILKKIVTNVRHGSKRKLSLQLAYVSNQLLLKFDPMLGGLTQVLPNLYLLILVCVDFIKEKQNNHTKKCATSGGLLEIVHTNICANFDSPYFGREKYFTTFIDDFSLQSYIYLLREKISASECLGGIL